MIAHFTSSQNFYLSIRRALTHRMCDTIYDEGKHDGPPSSLEEWETIKSKKLEILVSVIEYHLASDNRRPLMVSKDGALVENPEDLPAPPTGLGPDKIVVYSAFPSNNPLITRVRYRAHSHVIVDTQEHPSGPQITWHFHSRSQRQPDSKAEAGLGHQIPAIQ
jgi:hypothetical protein